MHASQALLVVISTLLSLAVARPMPMPTPQILNSQVGDSDIWTQVQGTPIPIDILPRMAQMLPRMAQMLNSKVSPNGNMWTEAHGQSIPASESPTVSSHLRRMIDARWWW